MCEGVLGYPAPPSRKNIEFFLGLRNKIEHRYYPELDPALYGECQAMLMILRMCSSKSSDSTWLY